MDSRILTALALYAFLVLGAFLLVAPWTAVWEQAVVGLLPTEVGRWAVSGWARGAVSGLGALDLYLALQVGGVLWSRMRAAPRDGAD